MRDPRGKQELREAEQDTLDSVTQVSVTLLSIAGEGPVRASRLVDILDLDVEDVVDICGLLKKKGMVKKTRAGYSLTPRGSGVAFKVSVLVDSEMEKW